jgi:hypothetical protein
MGLRFRVNPDPNRANADSKLDIKLSRPLGIPTLEQQRAREAEFVSIAATLDRAGLGPAEYLYSALKAAQNIRKNDRVSLGRALRKNKNLREALRRPPANPVELAPAPILVATSYSVSKKLLTRVAAAFNPGEVALYEIRPGQYEGRVQQVLSLAEMAIALGPSIVFALRARFVLQRTGVDTRYCNLIAAEAIRHRIFTSAARAVLRRVRPKCLLIANANRPFELALWSVARTMNIKTVLLPYQEINLKPGRLFSLCRGDFDLVLTYSNYSATQFRRLRRDVRVIAAGYPEQLEELSGEVSRSSRCPPVLYLGGTVLESDAAPVLREAFERALLQPLRVRVHPRMDENVRCRLFGWLPLTCFTDAKQVDLAKDIRHCKLVVTVRSTAVLRAYFLGVPVIWLTPMALRAALSRNSLREQGLVVLEAFNASELRSTVERILNDEEERKRVVAAQCERLRRLGFVGDYFGVVTDAVRKEAGLIRG